MKVSKLGFEEESAHLQEKEETVDRVTGNIHDKLIWPKRRSGVTGQQRIGELAICSGLEE